MSHAVYVYDISHVIIDNLQFMMGTGDNRVDRFTRQDQVIAAFRKFATTMQCHVTLIVHPRKVIDSKLFSAVILYDFTKASELVAVQMRGDYIN